MVSLHRKVRKPTPEPRQAHQRRAHGGRHGRAARRACPTRVVEGARRRTITRSEPPTAPPPFDEWEAERAAALRTASRPSTIAATALTDEGGLDADERADRRAGEAAARHGPAAVAEGPLRLGGRSGGARRAADRSTSRPATASPRRWPRSARPRPSPTGSATSRSWSATRSARRSCRRRPPRRTGGRSTPARRRSAAACSRATSTCSTARPRAGRRRLQDRGHERPGAARRAGRGLPAPGRVVRDLGRSGHG